ncbi:putative transmembrane protein [Mycobacterium tuberculosis]|nr:putative transmembrane protein [Mycobacterium tuberculosis]
MTDRPHDWHRLSPRMLLVHPVHEMLRQLPVLIGSVVLGSATGNPVWPLAALGVTVVFGVLRWFFTTYRIDDENVSLRTGILSRRAVSVPRNRIRSVQTEARLLHRLLGLTVLRVGTGQEARGEAAFELDAVDSARVPRLRALLLAESLAPVEPTGRVLARWQSSWLRYAPLSFSGLVMIGAVIGLGYQTGLAVRLPESGFARSAVDAAQRAGVVLVVAVTVLLVVGVSALLAVLFSWLTYGNLLLRRGGSGQEGVLHLRHGLLRVREHTYDMRRLRGATLREPLLVRLLRGARLDAVMTGRRPAQVDPGAVGPDAGRSCADRSGADSRRAGVGVDTVGGVDRGLRWAGRRSGPITRAPRRRRLVGCARRQPTASPRLHRLHRHHRLDGAPDTVPAEGGGGDARGGHRGGPQGLSGARCARGAGVVGGRRRVALGGRQCVVAPRILRDPEPG